MLLYCLDRRRQIERTMELNWYCIHTKPKQEGIASSLLRSEVGIEVFCPFLRFERARRTGRTWVREAMFPGYVFACFDYIASYRHVKSVRGVIKIVSFGSGPATIVPNAIIRELRASVQDNETIEISPGIEEGEEVDVVSGPFQGVRAIVSRILPAKQRVAILLNLLGMEREVEVSMENVLPDIPHPLMDPSSSHPAKKTT